MPLARANAIVLVAPRAADRVKPLESPTDPVPPIDTVKPLPPATSQLHRGQEEEGDTTGRLRRYFVSRELDERAAPLEEWHLNTRALPRDALSVLALTLWISEDGRIDRWRVDGQAPPGEWPDAVLAPLDRTPMTPGVLDGRPVPSEMHVEINMDTRVIR